MGEDKFGKGLNSYLQKYKFFYSTGCYESSWAKISSVKVWKVVGMENEGSAFPFCMVGEISMRGVWGATPHKKTGVGRQPTPVFLCGFWCGVVWCGAMRQGCFPSCFWAKTFIRMFLSPSWISLWIPQPKCLLYWHRTPPFRHPRRIRERVYSFATQWLPLRRSVIDF